MVREPEKREAPSKEDETSPKSDKKNGNLSLKI
jgi:hypothetical protein